jgi:tryptophan 7-halogenase
MHICIIGTGASGWITSTILKELNFIKKITIIGSPNIPSIGVGESTTLTFVTRVLNKVDLKEFVRESDAAVKYGVYYKNWSKRNFIHYFKKQNDFLRKNTSENVYGELLANKDPETHIHDLIGSKMWNFIYENKVSLDLSEHPHSWHFDAGKFIQFLKKTNLKDPKVTSVDDTIIDCKFSHGDTIDFIVGESDVRYTADYFINCCGDNKLNESVFKNEYASLSQYLLTNKALVYPLKYTNKKEQFHPYTVAKTMKNGWRWITPTQSRIGTGYVFSDNHISIDEATNEFLEDIGDKTIQPLLVDFNPKFNKKPFKSNSCSIGMSSGFLEPLDAPGLAITLHAIDKLSELLQYKEDKSKLIKYLNYSKTLNNCMLIAYQWWCAFILHQYKTCWRRDTKFWIDHKNVECGFYEQIINSLEYVPMHLFENYEYMMFYLTTAGKDIQWKSKITQKPFLVEQLDTETVSHLDYIQEFYK